MIAGESIRRGRITVYAATLRNTGKTITNFHALDGIQPHQSMRDVGVEPVVNRFTQTHRHVARHHAQLRAATVTGLAQVVHIGFQHTHIGAGSKERVVGDMLPILERNR